MTMSPIRLSILRNVEDFLSEFKISADLLGRLAVEDHKICARIRTGKNVTLSRIEALLAFIDSERSKVA